MSDPIKRTETTHIDEVRRTSTSTVQWLLERANIAGTHPISHNNKLAFFIGGEEAFADIAHSIAQAKDSIDICCWGFDPGMELVRDRSRTWPRGETYGDLLIAAGERGVKVRLMVWYDAVAVQFQNPRNMPGHTHDIDHKHRRHRREEPPSARQSVRQAQMDLHIVGEDGRASRAVAALARRYYCMDWYDAAFEGRLKNIEVRKHSGDGAAIARSLKSESNQPSNVFRLGAERQGMVRFGTHHQKPILIDFMHDEGRAAVGYVMGLNSLTDYWDTSAHLLDDPRREREDAIGAGPTPECHQVKPLRDYACRIDGGRALVAVYNNFIKSWERIEPAKRVAGTTGKSQTVRMPEALLRKAKPGDSTVQIVRTQPAEGDKSIKDAYFQATDQAALAMGYIYLENQYFQYAEWAQRLMTTRRAVMEKWSAVCGASGKTERDMPILHVFIVIPLPERESMIPRTYDTLATLGQQESMSGQSRMIKEQNERKTTTVMGGIGQVSKVPAALPDVVVDANRIEKPDSRLLETGYGLKVCTAMLNACDYANGKWRYREIYIHSKLLLIDDTYLNLGSANLNQRSMAVDSEINLAAIAPDHASELRRRIWTQLGGKNLAGGGGSREEVAHAYRSWKDLMVSNDGCKKAGNELVGFLLSLNDERSSTIRLG